MLILLDITIDITAINSFDQKTFQHMLSLTNEANQAT